MLDSWFCLQDRCGEWSAYLMRTKPEEAAADSEVSAGGKLVLVTTLLSCCCLLLMPLLLQLLSCWRQLALLRVCAG